MDGRNMIDDEYLMKCWNFVIFNRKVILGLDLALGSRVRLYILYNIYKEKITNRNNFRELFFP